MRLLILADDVTGAADSAGRCFNAGLPATINLRPVPPAPDGVSAYVSDSRHLLPDQAANRVQGLLHTIKQVNGVWYKKIDSTLRGNIGSELDALLDTLGKQHAVITPAFPAQGRGLEHGALRSAVARLPVHLPTLLREQSRRAVTTLGLDAVRGGDACLAEQLAQAAANYELLVVDAMTDNDLVAIATATDAALPDAVLCGSAGLIGAVAARLGMPRNNASLSSNIAAPLSALVVVGSGSAIAHRQLAYLLTRQETTVIISGQALPDHLQPTVVVHLPPPTVETPLDTVDSRAMAAQLAAFVGGLLARVQPTVMVLVGGDTAAEILAHMSVVQLSVIAELLPGMPMMQGVDGQGRIQRIVLKAGNHGDDDALSLLLGRARALVEHEASLCATTDRCLR